MDSTLLTEGIEMTMPKFEPAAMIGGHGHPRHTSYLQSATESKLYGPMKPLYTADQLAEAYEAGKRDAIPEGWVLVPKEILDRFPEINQSNYEHDDACNLNAWGVELVLAAAPKGEE